MAKYQLQFRKKLTINTDPQRRCYNGCHFSSEEVWTAWGDICAYTLRETADDSARVFKDINPSREYRVLEAEL